MASAAADGLTARRPGAQTIAPIGIYPLDGVGVVKHRDLVGLGDLPGPDFGPVKAIHLV